MNCAISDLHVWICGSDHESKPCTNIHDDYTASKTIFGGLAFPDRILEVLSLHLLVREHTLCPSVSASVYFQVIPTSTRLKTCVGKNANYLSTEC